MKTSKTVPKLCAYLTEKKKGLVQNTMLVISTAKNANLVLKQQDR